MTIKGTFRQFITLLKFSTHSAPSCCLHIGQTTPATLTLVCPCSTVFKKSGRRVFHFRKIFISNGSRVGVSKGANLHWSGKCIPCESMANYCAFSLSLSFPCPTCNFKEKKKSLWGNPPQIAILLACCNYLDLFKFQSEWALLCLFHFCLLWPGKVSHLSSCHLANGVCPSCIHSRVAGFFR